MLERSGMYLKYELIESNDVNVFGVGGLFYKW